MVDLEKLKSVYKDKEPLDLELVKQLKLIRRILGAKFEIKDLDDNTTQTLVTGTDGTAVTPNVVFEANYEVKEIEAPFGLLDKMHYQTIQS